jgi:Mor family transcriptional regulator
VLQWLTSDAFRSICHDVTEIGQVITARHNLFSSYFTNSGVEFNGRQANVAAHVLAREATLSASSTIYFDDPIVLDTIIINEILYASFSGKHYNN